MKIRWVIMWLVVTLLSFAVREAAADDAGAKTYAEVCAACHQPTGLGVPDTFPPLAGHAAAILSLPGGRDYLARVVLYGIEGEITVNGKHFSGVMPPWGGVLSDAQLAGALNYVMHSWDNDKVPGLNFTPFSPEEIAAARTTKMTGVDVNALRGRLMPATASVAPTVPVTFTAEQADRGHAIYRHACQDCHGFNLDNGEFGGAPLVGGYFARHWGSQGVAALYGYVAAKMPPDRPGQLNPSTYADLVAFLLSKNGYTPGPTELSPDPDAQKNLTLKR